MSLRELQVRVPLDWKESVSNRLFELGVQGLEEKESGETVVLKTPIEEASLGPLREGIREYLTELSTILPSQVPYEVADQAMVAVDWASEYRKYYFAQALSRRFFLKPAWDTQTVVPPEQIPIVLDPGQAFGTGLHGTTKLSLELMDRVLKGRQTESLRFIDVGTGTGILAIAAVKLGLGRVVGVDTDPVAIEVATQNARANHCDAIDLRAGTLGEIGEKFDLMVSNILLETHRELVGEYEERLAPGGSLVLSGVLVKQRAELEQLLVQRGWRLMEWEEMGEWVGATFTR